MRLVCIEDSGELSLVEHVGGNIPRYAILSHTWAEDSAEVSFLDFTRGLSKSKAGYHKLVFCAKQAAVDNLNHFWLDTCCIDKSSSAELQEAINSMFQWYRKAERCYVYLSDVSIAGMHRGHVATQGAFQVSRWFTRGWTLQELLAPATVEFFSSEGNRLGDKLSLQDDISKITGIVPQALQGLPLRHFSIDTRLSWANKRETKREEDKAYSLMGIFEVHMPLIYGEGGENAFRRLRDEIHRALESDSQFERRGATIPLRPSDPNITQIPHEASGRHYRMSVQHRHQEPGPKMHSQQSTSRAAVGALFPGNEPDVYMREREQFLDQTRSEVEQEQDDLLARSYLEAVTHSRKIQSQLDGCDERTYISPLSEELAWFTNTNLYRSWSTSEGGCILYQTAPQRPDSFGRARNLESLLPVAWKSQPPKSNRAHIHTAHYIAESSEHCTFDDFLLSIFYQLLVATHQDASEWQDTMSEVEPKIRRRFLKTLSKDLPSIESGSLLDLIDYILKFTKHRSAPDQTFQTLCVLKNLHQPTNPGFVKELLQLKDSLRRAGVHLLITGSGWKPDTLPAIDEDTEYIECLQALDFEAMYTRRDQIAVSQAGTSQWLSTHPAFVQWRDRSSGMLWIQGKPGSGKSVLAKSIITNRLNDDRFLLASWFYSRRGGSTGMSHESMMKSITHQLLKQSRSLFDKFAPTHRRCASWPSAFAELLRLLSTNAICVLDGMDESVCRDTEGKAILQLLSHATTHPESRLKIIILSRPYRAIRQVYGVYDILMEAENQSDIKVVIKNGLQSLIRTIECDETSAGTPVSDSQLYLRLKKEQPRIAEAFVEQNRNNQGLELENIRQYLLVNAQGVMLWVALCIHYAVRYAERSLCTWGKIRKIIEELPKELENVYRTILSELSAATDGDELSKARRILSWIVVAGSHRPLRLKELLDIVSISDAWHETDTTRSDICPLRAQRPIFTSWIGFSRSLGYLCGPLVEFINVGERSSDGSKHEQNITAGSVVQLLHQTVKDFLEESSDHIFRFQPGEAQSIVQQDSHSYIHRVLPLCPVRYVPFLDDVNDNWKRSIIDTVEYLEDKFLLSFILSSGLICLQPYVNAASNPDESDWQFGKFFLEVMYWDTDSSETAKNSVVGRCFWLSCTLGMDTAVENLLCLSSLKAGWWKFHREVVLNGAGIAASDHELIQLHKHLTKRHAASTYVTPALTRHSLQDHWSLIKSYEDRRRLSTNNSVYGRPKSFHAGRGSLRLDTSPPPKGQATKRAVAFSICRILHFLEGYTQPLDTNVKDIFHCRCINFLRNQEVSLDKQNSS